MTPYQVREEQTDYQYRVVLEMIRFHPHRVNVDDCRNMPLIHPHMERMLELTDHLPHR
jgi:hypothetical protein